LARSLKGKQHTWQVSDEPIGSGDAGEVFQVLCVDQPDLTGMMKKPSRIATGGTIMRQAGQIAQESLALERLDGLPNGKAHPPRLLDEAPDYTQGTGNYFIVSETADGVDMASLLSEARQTGKPFPRRVIITVLDALFDLFSRAHKAGVLWNDVKLDHIYWHNPTGNVVVIDWGNAQFLSGQPGNHQRVMPRWEDYRQLVDTLGSFLQQNAPELYADLGWDEFEGQQLDSSLVSVLARRIAYQQQVISLRVMEYQSLIKVVLSDDPSLVGLERIKQYQQILEQIGAPWHQNEVLSYGQMIVRNALASGEKRSAVSALAIIWDLFGDTLELPWYLTREYFRQIDILNHPGLNQLVRSTFNQNWKNALWHLVCIAQTSSKSDWRETMLPVLRQKALGITNLTPYQTTRAYLNWLQDQPDRNNELLKKLSSALKEWHQKGKNLEASPFEYEVLNLLQYDQRMPQHIKAEIKKSFAPGQEIISELSRAWDGLVFDNLEIALKNALSWDPERWGIISALDLMRDFQNWLSELNTGPTPGEDRFLFLKEIAESRPEVEKLFGAPAWLKNLIGCLSMITQNQELTGYQSQLQNWCPWLSSEDPLREVPFPDLGAHDISKADVLKHFIMHLKTWSDIEAGLILVKQHFPKDYDNCLRITEGFKNLLSLNFVSDEFEKAYLLQDPVVDPNLTELTQALIGLLNWRRNIEDKKFNQALTALEDQAFEDWRLITHARRVTQRWNLEIFPILINLSGNSQDPAAQNTTSKISELTEVHKEWSELRVLWENIYQNGINLPFLETIHSLISSFRTAFYQWRQDIEKDHDQVEQILYQSQISLVRQISDRFSLLLQHSHQAEDGFRLVEESFHTTFTARMNLFEHILEHLAAMDELLIPRDSESHFSRWIDELQEITSAPSPEARQQVVLSLSDQHPLYALLVQSVFNR
jgi:serine/threonine protein kinase